MRTRLAITWSIASFAFLGDVATAQDVLAILRGMIDAASSAPEPDRSALTTRTRRAVMGYLQAA